MSRDARAEDGTGQADQTKTRLTLRPGQNGTKKLQDKYGDCLLAVRYRYDPARRVRLKTVEIIEEVLPWSRALPSGRSPDEFVLVRIGYAETNLRQQVKAAGGIWKPESKLWRTSWSVLARTVQPECVACCQRLMAKVHVEMTRSANTF